MRYGSYVAALRWARALLHLYGTLGSPLGAILGWAVMPSKLSVARALCVAGYWALSAFNVGLADHRAFWGAQDSWPWLNVEQRRRASREMREGLRLCNQHRWLYHSELK